MADLECLISAVKDIGPVPVTTMPAIIQLNIVRPSVGLSLKRSAEVKFRIVEQPSTEPGTVTSEPVQ
jgi:hypothetical protein